MKPGCIGILSVMIPALVAAQNFPDLKFNHLTMQDGLSSNKVLCVKQDARGVMWIGTNNGLNRYDGSSFTYFTHQANDSSSICDDDIRYIEEDAEKQFWLCTANGLCRFNPFTGKAVNYFHKEKDPNSLADNYENFPFIDNKKKLWLATHHGIQLFDYKYNRFTSFHMPAISKAEWKQQYDVFRLVRQDASGRIWALSFYGLYLVDEANKKLVPYSSNDYGANIAFIQEDNGDILIGKWGDGLVRFDPLHNTYTDLWPKKNDIIFFFSSWKDGNGQKWTAVAKDDGIMLINPVDHSYKEYEHKEQDPQSPNSYLNTHVFQDSDNRLWFSGDNGIDIIDPRLQYFTNYRLYEQVDPDNPKKTGVPRSFVEMPDKSLLSFWYMKGVKEYDHNWKLLKTFNRIPENSSSSYSGCINHISQGGSNITWFGTDSGLVKQEGTNYKVYNLPGAESIVRGDYAIRNIIKRKDNTYWVRAINAGIFIFDPVTEIFTRKYLIGPAGLHQGILCMFQDSHENLWAGTDSGLYYFDAAHDRFTKFTILTNKKVDENTNTIWNITEDKDGMLWAASRNGLVKINAQTLQYSIYNESNGLPYPRLQQVLIDTTGNLWISCEKGLIRFDKQQKFQLYTDADGLPFNFTETAGTFSFTSTGNILVGSNGNITSFNPYNCKINNTPPVLIFSAAIINGKYQLINTESNEHKVVLNPGETNIIVHFSILNYTNPKDNKYYYQLEGIDHAWLPAEKGNAYFTNLPPGKYRLWINGHNNNGVYSKQKELLWIIVRPYWYQTGLFKTVLAIALVALVYFIFRKRVNSIRKESALKQKLAETQMQALRAQMNPHFIFNSLNSIENFMMQNNKRLASDYLNKFSRLIRSILNSNLDELVPVAKDMEALRLYVELEQLRFNDKFSYRVDTDPELVSGDYKVPSLVIQPFVENAIIHGIAHSDHPGLFLHVTARLNDDAIEYIIEDNGIGREKAAAYNQLNKPLHKSVGMGITKDLIHLYNKDRIATDEAVRITDLYDAEHRPAGTRITVKLKTD